VSNEWPFVVAAYTATWLVLIGYATYVELRRRRAVRAEREAPE
jgi:hypothetical protein